MPRAGHTRGTSRHPVAKWAMAVALGLTLPAAALATDPAAAPTGMPKQRPAGSAEACPGGRTGPVALRAEEAAGTPPLRPGEPVCLRLRPRQSAYFRIAPEAGDFYTVSTRNLAQGTDTVLALLDSQARLLAEDDDGARENLASSIEAGPEFNAALVRAGTLEGQGGGFELLLVRDAPRPPPDFPTSLIQAAAQPPLASGQMARLRLRRGQAAYYAMPEARDGLVARTLNLEGDTDTVLALLDGNGQPVSEDDDGGGGTASALPLDGAPAGPLFLRASILGDDAGSFDLVLRQEAPPPPPDFPTTLEEARRQDPLPADGTRAITLHRRQQAIFALPPGASLVIQTRGLEEGTDTVLALLDEDGEVLLEDDDGGSGLASRIATAKAPGRAAFLRAGTMNGGPGRFDLVVRAVGAAAGGVRQAGSIGDAARRPTLLPGEAVAVRLEAGEAAVFGLPQDGRPSLALTFDLQDGADTLLELLDADGQVLDQNDDADGGLGSRLLAGPQPRPAFLRASGVEGAAAGFSLVIIRPAP
ncbi:hypothetical protein [Roseomonas marmotae]|uniref:Uncharacterized protein n=1 Tax=Roseomonas marmotae TaxID=2768161 RepID=A0ABS3KHR2_9PROT|nr:hypothetical protein [Roseomonas marmotae]MBO1077005.1 hypothetical protein [Roseomonas marmotae]QTI79803.1 hypothetical protein IAI58_03100 [Roseomonas marmotae]